MKRICLLGLALVFAALLPLRATDQPDWLDVVGLYPQPGSVTGQGEVAILIWLQNTRTPQDISRARGEATPSFGCFAGAIHLDAAGGGERPIEVADFPITEAIMDQARQDLEPVLASLAGAFLRPQPFVAIPAVSPVLPAPAGFSFPSRNAALGALYAQILCQYDQADRDALVATGNLLGSDQVLGGVHYPSDVTAGQRLGRAFATWWIGQPGRLQRFQEACGEWKQ